ncbi:MAG: DUF3179 domain-containing protein, partial [Bacteroidota bacterium]
MKKTLLLIFLSSALLGLQSCSRDSNLGGDPGTPGFSQSDWLLPINLIFNGGPGKDGIPSIDNPQFSNSNTIDGIGFMGNDDLVVAIKVGESIRAYPHSILDWHEIVNDSWDDLHLAITYCPLTGTAVAWNRTINGRTTTFGVSGLLHNSNLMPFDRDSDSVWSQMLLQSVNGSNMGDFIETYPVVETTYEEMRTLYPDVEIMDIRTGFNRSYGVYPYGNYLVEDRQLRFPVTNEDLRLPFKERGLGISSENAARFYRFSDFNQQSVNVANDDFD